MLKTAPSVPTREIKRIAPVAGKPRKDAKGRHNPLPSKTIRSRALGRAQDGTLITVEGNRKRPDHSERLKKLNAEARAQGKPMHPALEANKWKPGQSGNPSGRPKRKALSEAYKALINSGANCTLPGYEHMTWPEAIAFGMGVEAVLGGNVGGSVAAAKEIRDVVEGPTSADSGIVPSITVIFGDDDEPDNDDPEEKVA